MIEQQHGGLGRSDGSPSDRLARRDLLIAAPLLAALPQLLGAGAAEAAADPDKTFVLPPSEITYKPDLGGPPRSVEVATLFSDSAKAGIYLNLTRWYPGYMDAPHWYETDRLCVVLSGTWWVASGDIFDPNLTVPVTPGSFVRRIAQTRNFGGVKSGGTEPAVIAVCGIGPITLHPVDASQPLVRKA